MTKRQWFITFCTVWVLSILIDVLAICTGSDLARLNAAVLLVTVIVGIQCECTESKPTTTLLKTQEDDVCEL